jgi:prolyl-tRNA synthetase
MGIPHRVVVSSKSVGGGGVELKKRNESESSIISIEKLLDILK